MPNGRDDLLKTMLSAAVPLWIMEFKNLPWAQVSKIASDAGQFIAEHGDALMYKQKGVTKDAFNHLAKGIAALSFAPGGVKTMGMHFESRHEASESAVGISRPVTLTFERGTLGRFILRHGLELAVEPVASNPPLDDPTKGTPAHFTVTLRERSGREYSSGFSSAVASEPSIEDVVEVIALDALDVERVGGSVEQYADLMGFEEPDEKVAQELRDMELQAASLREFLGLEAYQELLAIAEGSQGRPALGATGDPEEDCPAEITFQADTMGRIALLRGLGLFWVPVLKDPRQLMAVVKDKWNRQLYTDFAIPAEQPKPSLDEVLIEMGRLAIKWEKARGEVREKWDKPHLVPARNAMLALRSFF